MTGAPTRHGEWKGRAIVLGDYDSVVITGLGATTPLGGDVESTWSGLLAGRSAVRRIEEDWAQQLPVRIAAPAALDPAASFDRVQARRLDRCSQFGILAVREAWADAGFAGPAELGGEPDADRVGVSVGTGVGGISTLLKSYDTLNQRGPRLVSPIALPMVMPNNTAVQISLLINARAGLHAANSACATGAEALVHAVDMLRLGRADVVVAGGTEAMIHPLPIVGFANMMAMSRNNEQPERASRPFDRARDGFVLGEGAAALVLETARHARARGAKIYCELAGVGITSDAYHLAQPDESGRGISRALGFMLADGGLGAEEVVHVNAHATSTPQGDLAEARALCAALGTGGYAVSAIKSMTGHLIGAAGALSAVVSVLALRDRVAHRRSTSTTRTTGSTWIW
jgi:3-oxoacyl-[acyl-carrier-protein] synthase II